MKYLFVLKVIIYFITINFSIYFSSIAKDSLEQIHRENYKESNLIKFEDVKDENTLIVYLYTGNKEDNISDEQNMSLVEKIINESCYPNPILLSLYIKYLLNQENINNDKVSKLLFKFYQVDSENALSAYLLSYYYALNSDHENYIKYLKIGNNKSKLDLYTDKKKKIIYNYYNKTDNQIFPYLAMLQVYLDDFNTLISQLSRQINSDNKSIFYNNNNQLPYAENKLMGVKLEASTETIVDKKTGIGIQLYYSGLDQNNNKALILERKLKHFDELSNMFDTSKMQSEKQILTYLQNVYKYGEVYALEQLN